MKYLRLLGILFFAGWYTPSYALTPVCVSIDSTEPLRPVFTVQLTKKKSKELDQATSAQFKQVLQLRLLVDNQLAPVPVDGHYTLEKRQLSFQPKRDLGHGLKFKALYAIGQDTCQATYSTPPSTQSPLPAPQMVGVFPATAQVPANVLCFHVVFDQPMQDDPLAYLKAHILNDQGEEIPLVWKQQSSWADQGRVLVLMVHPGRVKRGITYMGNVFESGKSYRLVVDAGLKNQDGTPCAKGLSKQLQVGANDRESPKVYEQGLVLPVFGSRQGFTVPFSEGMDYSTVMFGAQVLDSSQQIVPGSWRFDNDSTFTFTPETPWKTQTYSLVLDRRVSDFAGNRMGRLFEIQEAPAPNTITKPYVVNWSPK